MPGDRSHHVFGVVLLFAQSPMREGAAFPPTPTLSLSGSATTSVNRYDNTSFTATVANGNDIIVPCPFRCARVSAEQTWLM